MTVLKCAVPIVKVKKGRNNYLARSGAEGTIKNGGKMWKFDI